MATIGIDARLWGTKHTGIGRYTQKLIENLRGLDIENEYVIFCRSENIKNIETSPGWKKVVADIPHYSLGEQTSLVQIFLKENLDLLHVPHFNVPVFYPKAFCITIHDILWHSKKGFDVTTLPPIKYLAKYAGYRLVVKSAASRAKAIFVPSKSVANEVEKRFPDVKQKVYVTYEGVDALSRGGKKDDRNYLLYVGNLYPHKNVETLVHALSRYHVLEHGNKLIVVSRKTAFLGKFRKFIKTKNAKKFVELKTNVDDKELGSLYKNAKAFIFPTLSEGFGLPGLEAMSASTPVVCSDIPVLREVYGNAPLYFDPKDPQDIADKIQKVLSNKVVRINLIKAGKIQVKKFSWKKMAQETLSVYREVLKG
ncbi:MAG: glycosyltransferase family 1 protein [Patescibacteria group bacterium]